MVFDTNGRPIDFKYIEVNKNFEKLTGLTGVVGKKVTELIPGITASNPELLEIYGRVALTGKPEKFETYVAPLSRWFSVSAYSPKKNFFVAAFEDVTAHKQVDKDLVNAKIAARNVLEDLGAEKERYEALAKDLEKFKLASDSVSDQIVITDPEGIVLYINQATERLTGYMSDEITGKKVGTLWHFPMPKEFYQNLWKTIKTDKKTFVGELQNRRKNGEIYDAELRISPVLDKDNNVLFFVGIERDVSEVKKLIDAKNETIAKDAAILSSIGDGLIATDHEGNIVLMDVAAENMLGLNIKDVAGRQMLDVIRRYDAAGNTVPPKERLLTRILAGEKVVTPMASDTYFERKDGAKFPVRIVVTPILNDGTITGAVEIFQDITKEKEVDRAKSEFVSLASHQLRTPPTIIGWYTETLQSGELGPFNEKQAEYLKELYKANQRMINIIN
jgi:PAS domain S-box-containing protein